MPSQADKELIRKARAELFIMPNEYLRLGDRVAGFLKRPLVAKAVKLVSGIDTHKPCGGCKKRQAWLNKIGV